MSMSTPLSTLTPMVRSRLGMVWLFLIGATLLSWWLGTDHGLSSGDDHRFASIVIIAVAFVKLRLVGLYFMELRDAPLALRTIFEIWCVAVFALVTGMYLAGT